jgi:hypothetical protein
MNRSAQVICASGIASLLIAVTPRLAAAADPTAASCLKANNSAVELRNDNKLQASRAQLLVCAAKSCPVDIRKECLRRVDEMNAAIPTIIFEAKDGSGNDLSAVTVIMDGEPFAERLDGTALPIDPGEHTFTFVTEGHPPVKAQFVIREAQKNRRESITLGAILRSDRDRDGVADAEDACPDNAGVKTDDAKTNGCPPARVEPTPPAPGLGTQKALGIFTAGVGVVGLGVGSIFGMMAMSQKDDAQNACPDRCANQSGVNLWSDAKRTAQIADIAFVVGGVGIVGGSLLWFTAGPSGSQASTQVGLGPGGAQLIGIW